MLRVRGDEDRPWLLAGSLLVNSWGRRSAHRQRTSVEGGESKARAHSQYLRRGSTWELANWLACVSGNGWDSCVASSPYAS